MKKVIVFDPETSQCFGSSREALNEAIEKVSENANERLKNGEAFIMASEVTQELYSELGIPDPTDWSREDFFSSECC